MSALRTTLKRVVHVVGNLNYGGLEKLMVDIVRLLDKSRFETHVLALQYLGRYARDMEGYATLHLCPPMSSLSLLHPVTLAKALASLRPDVVHTHSGVWYKAVRAARLAGVPRVVHTEHGQPRQRIGRILDRRAARLTDVVVAVSSPLRTYLSKWLHRPERLIETVRNGVDTHAFAPRPPSGALRRELGLRPEQRIVGSIGRLEAVKGYEVVIEAFDALRRRLIGPEPVLVIAGEGSARPSLEALIAHLGLGERVFLLGWRDDPPDLYAHFACFVMGSWSEGTSVSLLEAMASGVPPVVTRVGGNIDVLGSELAEWAVAPGEVAALADGMSRVLQPGARVAMGAAARRRVEEAFPIEATVRAYERLYEEPSSSLSGAATSR